VNDETPSQTHTVSSHGMRPSHAITPLRVMLLLAVLSALPFAFYPGDEGSYWWIMAEYVMPALVVIFAWVLLLDMLMVVVFRAARQPTDRSPYRNALLLDASMFAALLYTWLPFYLKLLS